MARTRVRVVDIEARLRRSGNSFNFVRAEQAASAAAGLLAVAIALTGGVNVDGRNAPAVAAERNQSQP